VYSFLARIDGAYDLSPRLTHEVDSGMAGIFWVLGLPKNTAFWFFCANIKNIVFAKLFLKKR
jgi:hypothetical protein